MVKEYKAEVFGSDKYSLGEGPYYDPRYNRYSWVDIPECRLWTMKDGIRTCFQFKEPIGAAIPLKDSEGFLLVARYGLYTYEDGQVSMYQDLTETYKSYWRSNDAKADPQGRLWFGSYVMDGYEAEGNLYFIDTVSRKQNDIVRTSSDGGQDLTEGIIDASDIVIKQPDTKIANGMAWSADRTKFYFSDSNEHAVFVYDYDDSTAKISNRRVLFEVKDGVPDGLCIDSEDNIWVAVWGGRRIEKHDGRNGDLLAIINVPAEHVSSCCFMKEDGEDYLFITSSGADLNGEYDGCLFKCKVDVEGPAPDYVFI